MKKGSILEKICYVQDRSGSIVHVALFKVTIGHQALVL